MKKPDQEEVIQQRCREAVAKALTEAAESACEAAAGAWDEAGLDQKRDDCLRARRLLPGAMP